jgi:hypothetical protein
VPTVLLVEPTLLDKTAALVAEAALSIFAADMEVV